MSHSSLLSDPPASPAPFQRQEPRGRVAEMKALQIQVMRYLWTGAGDGENMRTGGPGPSLQETFQRGQGPCDLRTHLDPGPPLLGWVQGVKAVLGGWLGSGSQGELPGGGGTLTRPQGRDPRLRNGKSRRQRAFSAFPYPELGATAWASPGPTLAEEAREAAETWRPRREGGGGEGIPGWGSGNCRALPGRPHY